MDELRIANNNLIASKRKSTTHLTKNKFPHHTGERDRNEPEVLYFRKLSISNFTDNSLSESEVYDRNSVN